MRCKLFAMREEFKNGDAPLMIATIGTVQTGLNLACASRAVFAVRGWGHVAEDQALHRLLRPQQTRHVVAEFIELEGSLDTYKAQMVEMKGRSATAVVDDQPLELDDRDFIHLDAIIDRFVADIAELRGQQSIEFREAVKAAAA